MKRARKWSNPRIRAYLERDSGIRLAFPHGIPEKGINMTQLNVTYRTVVEEIEKVPEEYLPFLLEIMRAFRESITLKPAEERFGKVGRKPYGGKHGRCQNCGKTSMPDETARVVQVEFTPEFKRNIRQLAKKYRHLQADVQPVIAQLASGQTQEPKYHERAIPSSKSGFKIRISRRGSGRDTAWYTTSKPPNLCC